MNAGVAAVPPGPGMPPLGAASRRGDPSWDPAARVGAGGEREATLQAGSFASPSEIDGTAGVDVSVVVIGRNEGARLLRCLASVDRAHWGARRHETIYVDSRSTDGSPAAAAETGARVIVLDDDSPCAAKARNLGWQAAHGRFVLFLDGDTELHPDFVGHALEALRDERLCAAWGHRRESDPGQSIYTRVLDLDWVYPAGRTLYFGGDVLVRREALAQAGGFDPSLKAGEEPELCARLRALGWEIEHLDLPMTSHDLAVRSLRAWWRRAWRSGVAYAEVAARVRERGDVLWQRESVRDLRHGALYLASPLLFAAAWAVAPLLAAVLLVLALALLLRTARRSAWKAPGRPALLLQYALHVHLQKIPAFFGQMAWRRARRGHGEIGLVEYKDAPVKARAPRSADAGGSLDVPVSNPCSASTAMFARTAAAALPLPHGAAGSAGSPEVASAGTPRRAVKRLAVRVLVPLASLWTRTVRDGWLRVWSLARLQAATGSPIDPSNVVLGPVDVQGTARVRLGKGALIYPGVVLETQGDGVIEIGDGVVLSRGVHIVAFERVRLGDGAMVGEYSSLRDANHRRSDVSVRDSGHDAAPIEVGRNVWIGRGATVLKGVMLGEHAVVAANAVVTRPVAAGALVGGVPARTIGAAAAQAPAPLPSLQMAPTVGATSSPGPIR